MDCLFLKLTTENNNNHTFPWPTDQVHFIPTKPLQLTTLKELFVEAFSLQTVCVRL